MFEITIVFSVLIVVYCAMLLFMHVLFHLPEKATTVPPTSKHLNIIVPHKADTENLKQYLAQIKKLEAVEAVEWIISEDGQDSIFQDEANLTFIKSNINAKTHGKKQALLNAMQHAKAEYIIVHDADVLFPDTKYLKRFYDKRLQNLDLWIGLYQLEATDNYFLDALQLTENNVLQLLTYGFARIGNPILCSGANIAYNKKQFQKLQAYQNNLDILSGDDLFLLEAAVKNKTIQIGTSNDPSLILKTKAKSTWTSYISQRIRWASKSKYLKNYLMHSIAIISVGAHTAGLTVLALYCITQQWVFLFLFGLKVLTELIIGFTGHLRLEKKFTAAGVLISSFYSLVLIYMLIFSFRKKTTWKGRTL